MPKDSKSITEVSRDYTINLHKRLHKICFKRKAPRAIKEISKFAKKNMLTEVNYHKNKKNIILIKRIKKIKKIFLLYMK